MGYMYMYVQVIEWRIHNSFVHLKSVISTEIGIFDHENQNVQRTCQNGTHRIQIRNN